MIGMARSALTSHDGSARAAEHLVDQAVLENSHRHTAMTATEAVRYGM